MFTEEKHNFIYLWLIIKFSCFIYAQMSTKLQKRQLKMMINTHNVIESVTCNFIALKFKCSLFSSSLIKKFPKIQYILDA